MFDESTALIRKVKEVALIQKQKERDFIQARRAIERIRKSGKTIGRPQNADIDKVRMLREQGLSLSAIAKECGISKTRVHQILAA